MDDSYEVYTQEEIDLIDSCKKITGKLLEDEEIYELILKYNYDKNKVKKELIEYIDLVNKKGDDYTWNLVQKDKNNKIHDHYLPQNRTNNQTRTQNGNLKFKSNNKFPRNYNNADFSIQQEVNKEHDPSVNSKPTNVYNKYTKETELENKKKKKKKKDRSINDLFEKALNLESKHVPQTKEEVPDKEKETVNPTQEVKPQGITIDSTFTQKEFEKKENIMEEPQENSTVPFPNWPSSFNSIHPCSEINDFAIVDEPRQSNNMNFAPGFFPYLTIPQNMQNPNFENANAYMNHPQFFQQNEGKFQTVEGSTNLNNQYNYYLAHPYMVPFIPQYQQHQANPKSTIYNKFNLPKN